MAEPAPPPLGTLRTMRTDGNADGIPNPPTVVQIPAPPQDDATDRPSEPPPAR